MMGQRIVHCGDIGAGGEASGMFNLQVGSFLPYFVA